MKRIPAVGILSLFFLTGGLSAADVVKIGVVDFQEILKVSNAGKSAQVESSKQGKQMETDLKNKAAEIEDIEKKMERESLLMRKEIREEKQREIRIRIGDLKALQQKYLEDFKALEIQSILRIQQEVTALVQDIGNAEGYTLIVEKQTDGVVYTLISIDITDVVIQKYDARTQQSESGKTFDTDSDDFCRLMIQFEAKRQLKGHETARCTK